MKAKLFFPIAVLLLMGIFVLNTSFSDTYFRYWNYIPVFMKRSDLDNSVSYHALARDLENPGKIYFKSPYIYINERYKGVHVINNSDPYNPIKEGFIVAPGCIDMAVKENVMYVDNAVDLVAIDLLTKTVSKRIKNVFPEPLAPDNSMFYNNDRENYVLVEWKKNPDKK
ncbi:MAG: hypothetical protein LBT25_00780 [Candidatus Symbiothrix sp.]|jgi:hypothetical protein|nr:hypothetical protein [Candidatus Symbiothrix sp.]